MIQPGDRADGLPEEAFDLLLKSATDSCGICAREHRQRAFQLLEERFSPGVIVTNDSLHRFLRVPGGENELVFAPPLGGESEPTSAPILGEAPHLTFRFHTAADHLVGISESDLTDERLAARCLSAPAGAAFRGVLEIVGFAYGDGATFQYHASTNRVQVHCKIIEIGAE